MSPHRNSSNTMNSLNPGSDMWWWFFLASSRHLIWEMSCIYSMIYVCKYMYNRYLHLWRERCTSLCTLDTYCTYILLYIYCKVWYMHRDSSPIDVMPLLLTFFQGTNLKILHAVPSSSPRQGEHLGNSRNGGNSNINVYWFLYGGRVQLCFTIHLRPSRHKMQAFLEFTIQLSIFGYLQSFRKATRIY